MPITIVETHEAPRAGEPRRLALIRRGARWAVVDLLEDDGHVLTASDLEDLRSEDLVHNASTTTSIKWRTEARARAELRHLTAQEGPCTTTAIFDLCAACATSASRSPSRSTSKRRPRGRR